MSNVIEMYFDGSCEPNNPGGRMGMGTLIKKDGVHIFANTETVQADSGNTNNIAEYRALINGLGWLIENNMNHQRIAVYGDSKLVIMQMSNEWAAKAGRYLPYYKDAMSLRSKFTKISFKWIPRKQNSEADQLSREASA
ncbi:MAG: ribonuclease HI family protein [Bacteroidia bacterium]